MAYRGLLDFLKPKVRTRVAVPASLFVEHDGRAVPVAVHVRANAHRMILKIDRRTGEPALTLPRGIGRVRAERFLNEHVGWLQARLAARPAPVAFAVDTILPIRGIPTRIVHRAPFRGETRLIEENGDRLLVVHGELAHLAGRVERFLRAEAQCDLAHAVARYAAALGVSYGRISIKDTTSRWGSCSARGDLSFSWRLILAPSFVLDYLAAHEIAHRLEMNHSVRYWRHVARICPDFRIAEHWLTRNGPGLHLYGRA